MAIKLFVHEGIPRPSSSGRVGRGQSRDLSWAPHHPTRRHERTYFRPSCSVTVNRAGGQRQAAVIDYVKG